MLLADYLDQCDVPESVPRQLCLDAGAKFFFGDRHGILTHTGVTIDVPDMEDILAIVRAEFQAERVMPGMGYESTGGGLKRVRRLTISSTNQPYTAAEMDACIARIRQAVTYYSLTGEWNAFSKDNL